MEAVGIENPKLLSPLNLAFVGDAVYELMVRRRLVEGGSRPVSELHAEAVRYVRAGAQSMCYETLCAVLNEEETAILKRGRNANSVRPPKSSTAIDYRRATAVEALLGYLFLCGEHERLQQLDGLMMETIRRQAEKMEVCEGEE